MIAVVVVIAILAVGGICYQSAHTKAPPVKYKWGQEPPSIGFTQAPKGMSDDEIMKHNREVLNQANKRK
jgi:hypothetical protein